MPVLVQPDDLLLIHMGLRLTRRDRDKVEAFAAAWDLTPAQVIRLCIRLAQPQDLAEWRAQTAVEDRPER
jgi:hypothetical protein